jgi:DNA polymerase-3 subunit chi
VTQIAFHFGAPDKLAYACRLLRKAAGSGARVLVVADTPVCEQLDAQLWAVSPADFVTHCQTAASPSLVDRSSVLLAPVLPQDAAQFPVLVNLGDAVPAGFDAFQRVIEIVSMDDEDRQQARARWKHYMALGFDIERHDLKLKGAN